METERLTVNVEEAAKRLGIGRSLAYEMVHTGKLPILRFGKRMLVPKRALELLLQSQDNPRLPDAA